MPRRPTGLERREPHPVGGVGQAGASWLRTAAHSFGNRVFVRERSAPLMCVSDLVSTDFMATPAHGVRHWRPYIRSWRDSELAAPQIAGKVLPGYTVVPSAPILPGSHEAHLPAKETQAGEDPRVPCPDEYQGRTRCDSPPAPQGPQAPLSLSMPRSGSGSPRRRRLSRSGDFKRVYRDGLVEGHPVPGSLPVQPG